MLSREGGGKTPINTLGVPKGIRSVLYTVTHRYNLRIICRNIFNSTLESQ